MRISQGLDIPIKGIPCHRVEASTSLQSVALLGDDYHGMRPSISVEVGNEVALGDALFEDKKQSGVIFTSPASGRVKAIHRGERRAFLSCVIEIDEQRDAADQIATHYPAHALDTWDDELSTDTVRQRLIKSGLWTAIRTRPFSKTPAIDSVPQAVFISTLDTRPLAANPEIVVAKHPQEFYAGVKALHLLTQKDIYLNCGINQSIPGSDLPYVHCERWEGKHPAGLVGTHMHMLLPVNAQRVNWHVGVQDVIAMGYLFLHGQIWVKRYVAITGPAANNPRILEARLGACASDIVTSQEIASTYLRDDVRVISGSVLGGRTCTHTVDYLSRWSDQITVIAEGRQRDFFLTRGWLSLGYHKFSVLGTYLGKFIPGVLFAMTTSTQGSRRAMVPIGLYEKVMPLDILPTYLLRALISKDTERAQELGALELDEEDLALCTFVCPGKYEYGPILRDNLDDIEKNG